MNKIKFSELKCLIINFENDLLSDMEIEDGVNFSEEKVLFIEEINKTKDIFDIIKVLEGRGYNKQGSIELIFNSIIDFQN